MYSSTTTSSRHSDFTPQDVAAKGAAFRIVDVRERDEYTGDLGHIQGAELVPLGTIASAAAGWDKKAPLIVVCRSGGRSGRAAAHLVQAGFEEVHNMVGGMLRWSSEGRPVVR